MVIFLITQKVGGSMAPKTANKKDPRKTREPLISMAERMGFEPTVAINHT